MRDRRAGLLCGLSYLLALPVCMSQLVQYSLTVRDFLPVDCSLVDTEVAPGLPFLTRTAVNNVLCPYQSDILAGKVSGHPDFQKDVDAGDIPGYLYDLYKVVGSKGFLRGQPGRRNIGKTVEQFLELAPSGLPKPVYCSSNPFAGANGTVRCGYFFKNNINAQLFSTVSIVNDLHTK